jgi:SAM-dependent methyltransferase
MSSLVDCPHCGAAQGAPLFDAADPLSADRFEIRRCTRCALVHVSPRPTPERLAQYYPDGYFGKRHPLLKNFFMNLRVGALPATPGRVLDIGCGRADFLMACRRRGWQVAGVEQDGAPIMELRRELGLEVVSTTELATLPDASFDAVTMWHVFEHMFDPHEMLREIVRLLRPGGTAVIEVPNFGSWQARIDPQYWFHLDVPRHLLHFERPTLEAMLDSEGLRPVRWSTFSAEYDAFGILQSFLNRLCTTPNYLFQVLIGRRGKGTAGDALVTALTTLPLAALATILAVVAPLFGEGGVLRVVAVKPLQATGGGQVSP